MHGIVCLVQCRCCWRSSLGFSRGTKGSVDRSTTSVMYCLGLLEGEPKSDAFNVIDLSNHMFVRFRYSRDTAQVSDLLSIWIAMAAFARPGLNPDGGIRCFRWRLLPSFIIERIWCMNPQQSGALLSLLTGGYISSVLTAHAPKRCMRPPSRLSASYAALLIRIVNLLLFKPCRRGSTLSTWSLLLFKPCRRGLDHFSTVLL